MLPILLVLAVLGASVEGYGYRSSAGRDMLARQEQDPRAVEQIEQMQANQHEIFQKLQELSSKVSALEKKKH